MTGREEFGHQPIISFLDGRALARVCARCHPAEPGIVHAVRWPCRTAAVLGLDMADETTTPTSQET
ncbi:hypothetical protein [Streptacidiphilus sp. PAMC 29251]